MKNEIVQEWLHTAGLVLVGVVIFVGGFYFGGKSAQATIEKDREYDSSIASFAREVSLDSEITTPPAVNVLSLEGVHWIKVGEPPVCPETHPLKGKFDSNVNVYYREDYPQFDNVKPHICLASEQFALEKAGFIRKY